MIIFLKLLLFKRYNTKITDSKVHTSPILEEANPIIEIEHIKHIKKSIFIKKDNVLYVFPTKTIINIIATAPKSPISLLAVEPVYIPCSSNLDIWAKSPFPIINNK